MDKTQAKIRANQQRREDDEADERLADQMIISSILFVLFCVVIGVLTN